MSTKPYSNSLLRARAFQMLNFRKPAFGIFQRQDNGKVLATPNSENRIQKSRISSKQPPSIVVPPKSPRTKYFLARLFINKHVRQHKTTRWKYSNLFTWLLDIHLD